MASVNFVLELFAAAIALLGYFPLFANLELLPKVLFPAALLLRCLGGKKGFAADKRLITWVSIGITAYYLSRFREVSIAEPAVALLVSLLAVRLLEERSQRNYLQIFALSVFCLAGSSLFELKATFLAYLALLLVLIATSLVLLTFCGEEGGTLSRRGLRKVLLFSLLMPGASLLLIPLFFPVLPRTQFPLWDRLHAGGARASGFSEKVEPGSTAALADRTTIAFRAEMPHLDREALYWRGIVLNRYENGAWVRIDPPEEETDIPGKGLLVDQVIYPESESRFLVSLSVPLQVSGVRSRTSPDFVVSRTSFGSSRFKYRVRSLLTDTLRVSRKFDMSGYLAAEGAPPRLAALGKSLRGKPAEEVILSLEEFYRQNRIRYSRENVPGGPDALDSFLFDARRGYCEYFASSCALLLRLAGVPARLVGGYYSGEYNDIGGYFAVTESAAHVWVEAYLPGRGWLLVDPSRWGTGFTPAGRGNPGLFRKLMLYADAMSYFWNARVISYDLEKQVSFVRTAGRQIGSVRIPKTGKGAFLLTAAASVLVLGYLLFRRKPVFPSPEERILRRFLRRLGDRRGTIPAGAGLHAMTAGIDDPAVQEFVRIYSAAVYRDRCLTPDEIRRLAQLTKQMKTT